MPPLTNTDRWLKECWGLDDDRKWDFLVSGCQSMARAKNTSKREHNLESLNKAIVGSCTKMVVPGTMETKIDQMNALASVMFKDGKTKTKRVNLVID